MLYRGTNSYSVNSCDTIEIFYNIRTDLDKLKYATHITKIINDVTDENQNTYKILQLFLNIFRFVTFVTYFIHISGYPIDTTKKTNQTTKECQL